MIGSRYLGPKDYPGYGLPPDTKEAHVRQASVIVDQVLGRPEGVVWMPDYRGAPAYMAALTPTMVFESTTAVAPGVSVPVPVTPPIATQDLVGEVLVLSRAAKASTEACVVEAVSADGGTVTLAAVALPHAAGTDLDLGLAIAEERPVAPNRQLSRVSRAPVVRLLSLQGRYGYGRRSDQISGHFQTESILSMVQPFGGAPPWVPIEVGQAAVSANTGQIFVPVGLLLAAFSDVRIRYVAGWPDGSVPPAIRAATAICVQSIASTPEGGKQAQVYKAANAMIRRFDSSDLDEDTRRMLQPYKAMKFF